MHEQENRKRQTALFEKVCACVVPKHAMNAAAHRCSVDVECFHVVSKMLIFAVNEFLLGGLPHRVNRL